MYKFELQPLMANCPLAWKNFAYSLQPVAGTGLRPEDIRKGLKEFNIVDVQLRPSVESETPYLLFDTEEDATAFVLKWS